MPPFFKTKFHPKSFREKLCLNDVFGYIRQHLLAYTKCHFLAQTTYGLQLGLSVCVERRHFLGPKLWGRPMLRVVLDDRVYYSGDPAPGRLRNQHPGLRRIYVQPAVQGVSSSGGSTARGRQQWFVHSKNALG